MVYRVFNTSKSDVICAIYITIGQNLKPWFESTKIGKKKSSVAIRH